MITAKNADDFTRAAAALLSDGWRVMHTTKYIVTFSKSGELFYISLI